MALDVRIISGGTTYYLVNSSGVPTPGGSATSASTTPYSVNAAEWTQTAAPRQTIYSGGPPFRVGSTPLYTGYGNVTETIDIGVVGSSSDNVISLIQTLRKILNTALYSYPAILYWQPSGATNPTYFEIYSADVQETGDWQNPSAGFTSALCRVTWVRSAVGGWLSAGETLISTLGLANPSVTSLGTGKGDFIYDGGPLNQSYATSSGGIGVGIRRLFAGVVSSRYNDVVVGGVTSNSSAWQMITNRANVWAIGLTRNNALKARIIGHFSAFTSNAQAYVSIPELGWNSPIIGPLSGTTLPTLVDFGGFDLSSLRPTTTVNTKNSLSWILYMRSTNGANATVTSSFFDFLTAYTFATIDDPAAASITSTYPIDISSFQSVSNRVALPYDVPVAYRTNSSTNADWSQTLIPRGTVPRYYSGASLYLAWLKGSLTYASGDTMYARVYHAPLYLTMRGAN